MRTIDLPPPSRPPADDQSVQFGRIHVPTAATAAFDKAVDYLSQDAVERSLIDKLVNSTTDFKLHIITDGNDSYDPNTHQINWDPYSALKTTCGGHQSAALGLGHEIDHATFDPLAANKLANIYDPQYDNLEEKRVITGSETHAAHTLGENVRHDHSGSVYAVASPIAR